MTSLKGTAKGYNLVARVDQAIIKTIETEFAAALCDFIYDDGAQCLNLADQCSTSKRWEDHDDAVPQEKAKEKMREYLRNNGYKKGLMVDGEIWEGWYKE